MAWRLHELSSARVRDDLMRVAGRRIFEMNDVDGGALTGFGNARLTSPRQWPERPSTMTAICLRRLARHVVGR